MVRKTVLVTIPDYFPAGLIREVNLELVRWVQQADTVQLNCRIGMHWWPGIDEEATAWNRDPKRRVIVLDQACQRGRQGEPGPGCGVTRRQLTNIWGMLDSAKTQYNYRNAPGYQFHSGDGRGWAMTKQDRGVVRLELAHRRELGDTDAETG